MVFSSRDAAEALDLSHRQVQRLLRAKRVQSDSVAGRSVLSSRGVLALERTAGRGRRWNTETVIAALEILSNGETTVLRGSPRSRLLARLRRTDPTTLAYQALSGRVTLCRATSASPARKPSPAIRELGLTDAGGIEVRSVDDVDDVIRRRRLVRDKDGDVVLVELGSSNSLIAEVLALYGYGDERESHAAAAWIAGRVNALDEELPDGEQALEARSEPTVSLDDVARDLDLIDVASPSKTEARRLL